MIDTQYEFVMFIKKDDNKGYKVECGEKRTVKDYLKYFYDYFLIENIAIQPFQSNRILMDNEEINTSNTYYLVDAPLSSQSIINQYVDKYPFLRQFLVEDEANIYKLIGYLQNQRSDPKLYKISLFLTQNQYWIYDALNIPRPVNMRKLTQPKGNFY